jgi:hypothetical protein
LVNAVDALTAASGTTTTPISTLTATIQQVTPNPRFTAVNTIDITFSEAVTGFTINSLALQFDDFGNLLTGSNAALTGSGTSYMLTGLTSITGFEGTYTLVLTASGSGITGPNNTTLSANASMSWVDESRRSAPTATPAAATSLTATALSKHSTLLSWTNTSSSTYVVILRSLDKHFKTGVVRIQLDSEADASFPALAILNATYADGDLRAGTRYYYRIYEGNQYGLSTFTSAVSVLGDGLQVDYVSTMMSEAQIQALRATL